MWVNKHLNKPPLHILISFSLSNHLHHFKNFHNFLVFLKTILSQKILWLFYPFLHLLFLLFLSIKRFPLPFLKLNNYLIKFQIFYPSMYLQYKFSHIYVLVFNLNLDWFLNNLLIHKSSLLFLNLFHFLQLCKI